VNPSSLQRDRLANDTGPYFMLGMRIDTLDPQDVLGRVITLVDKGGSAYCCVSNVHQCMLTHEEPEFAAVINGADLVVTDSRVLQKFITTKYELEPLPTLRGAEMMMALCQRAAEQNLPIALVGGRDDALLHTLSEILRLRCPALVIACAFSPPFGARTAEDEQAEIEQLKHSGARLIFVGLGCPKQERWMARHHGKLQATMIGVGAAFDFNSGAVRKSPPWVHAAGFEWLYRLLAEPRRLWHRYLVESPRFLSAYWREERRRSSNSR